MIIPTRPNYTEMTPTEFEQFVLSLLREAAEGIPNAEIHHNQIIKAFDGEYQIDGTIRFQLMGMNYLTLVECKMYKSAVSREKVQVLYDKLRAVGAQKGILATTSYFQSGAIDYATAHGIALVQIIDGRLIYEVRSVEYIANPYHPSIPKFEGIAQYRISENSIGSSTIMENDYLSKFLIEKMSATVT